MIYKFGTAKKIRGRTYTIVGDTVYSAPEMHSGNGYSKSVDLWALGILIYQMLYCAYPFNIKSKDIPTEIVRKMNTESLTFPADSKYIRGNEVIADLLSLDSKKRPSLDQLKHSRWLDSIDWQSLNNMSMNPPFKPEIVTSKISGKLSKLTSLPRYVNV